MIDTVCLAEGQAEYIDSALEGGFTGLLLGTLIVAALIAVAVAPFVLRRYDAQARRDALATARAVAGRVGGKAIERVFFVACR